MLTSVFKEYFGVISFSLYPKWIQKNQGVNFQEVYMIILWFIEIANNLQSLAR